MALTTPNWATTYFPRQQYAEQEEGGRSTETNMWVAAAGEPTRTWTTAEAWLTEA